MIKIYPPPKDLVKFLKPFDPAVRKLALELRQLVLEVMAPCHENIYDAYSAVAIGYGSSDRLGDGICHIAVYGNHVNLGFNFGATLPDPSGILKGKGNQIRHIKVDSEEELRRPEIRSYLSVACKIARDDARKLGEVLPPPPKEVVSIVKAIYPKKRRPDKSGKIIVVTSANASKPTKRKKRI
jgi:Domain of unknown function (DU1801)